jgi:sigma-E factor negative regulatory protein RseB
MSERLAVATLLILLSVVTATATAADRDVRGWLQGMVDSVRTLNYRGTFVYLHDNHLESMQIIHSVDAGGEKEHLISLNGAAREVVRDDASVTCISPDVKSISVSRRSTGGGFRAVFSMDVDQLSEFYDFRLLQKVRVAGREAQVVAILPKDGFRYGYRIYLDTGNLLPLKTDMLNDSGVAISQIMFTSLQVDPEPVELAQKSMDGRENYSLVQREPGRATDEVDAGGWVFQRLPKGFKVRFRAKMPGEQRDRPVQHFVLSDGLASLSLYIESTGRERGLVGASTMGAVNAFGQVNGSHQITAVGAVPALTVETVAGSVVPGVQ